MIAIIDYGVGNLFSLSRSFEAIGQQCVITCDEEIIASAERLILPGVGAFGDAAKKLEESGMGPLICRQAEEGKPLLGVCLGMQLLFQFSEEYGLHKGLGLIPGRVVPLEGYIPQDLKIPHIGWNALTKVGNSPLLKYVKDGDFVYFVHSYYAADCQDDVIATTEYGQVVTAAAARGNVFGCQFHPEKSGAVGLNILRAFCEI